MGQYYKAPQGQFLDFIYQPNLDLQLAVADKEMQLDATKKAFAANTDYVSKPTFLAWQEDLDKSVGTLNEKIDPIVQKLVENPNDKEAYRSFKNLTQEARDMYSSGDVGYMTRNYAAYQNELQKIDKALQGVKDPELKTMYLDAEKKWRQHVNDRVKDYKGRYKEFGYNDFISPVDAQKSLAEAIDPEKMKVEISQLVRDKNFDVLMEQYPNIDHQYFITQRDTEGYQRALIEAASKKHLMNSEAFNAMLKQNFFTFNERLQGQNMNDTSAEAYRKYMEVEAAKQANTYASKFTGYKQKDKISNVKDDIEIYNAKIAKKKATENPESLTTLGRTKKVFTDEELKPAVEEYLNMIQKGEAGLLKGEQLQRYNDLSRMFAPLVRDENPNTLKDFNKYLPIINEDSWWSNEKLYTTLSKELKKDEDFGDIPEHKILEMFSNVKSSLAGGRGSSIGTLSKFDSFRDLSQDEIKTLIEPTINSLIYNKTIDGQEALNVAGKVVSSIQRMQDVANLQEKLTDEGSKLRQDLEATSVVNESYFTYPQVTEANKKSTLVNSMIDHVTAVAGKNQPDVVPTKYTPRTYQGKERTLTGKEGIDPLSTIATREDMTFAELITNNKISINMAPFGENAEKWEIFDNTELDENKQPKSYTVVYKNLYSSKKYWESMLTYAKDAESKDLILRAMNPEYNKIASQVSKRVTTLKNPKSPTGLTAIENSPLSDYYHTYLDNDDDGKFKIKWVDKQDTNNVQYMYGLSEAEAAYYINYESSNQKLVNNIKR